MYKYEQNFLDTLLKEDIEQYVTSAIPHVVISHIWL